MLMFLPLLGLLFPTVFVALSVYVAFHAVASIHGLSASFSDIVSDHWLVLLIFCGVALAIVAAAAAWQSLQGERVIDSPSIRRKAPVGLEGELLKNRLASIWSHLPVQGRAVPSVVWYSNFNVLAHAYDVDGLQTIEVSSGLWQRVTRNDPVADGILAHEAAHLVFHDRTMFQMLAVGTETIRQLLRIVSAIGMLATVIVMFSQIATDIALKASTMTIFENACTITIIAGLVFVVLPLSAVIARRYSGFIVSLMEVRADISAALWTSDLKSFSTALASDPTLRKSTFADLRHSVLSPNLTHISETERLTLLRSTDRLITPKIRYFALSLALPMLVPINAATYLIEGGAIGHALITSVVVSLQFAATAMLLAGSGSALLSWRGALYLGSVLCLTQSLPLIDLSAIGYLFTNYAISIVSPSGLGSAEMTLSQMAEDLWATLLDIGGKVVTATDRFQFLLAVVVGGLSLRAMSLLSQHCTDCWHLPALATAAASLFSSMDSWRDTFFSVWPLTISHEWFYLTKDVAWLRLCTPSVAAVVVLILLLPLLGWRDRSGKHRSGVSLK